MTNDGERTVKNNVRIAVLEKQLEDLRTFVFEQAGELADLKLTAFGLATDLDRERIKRRNQVTALNDQVTELRRNMVEQKGKAPENPVEGM